MDTCERTQLPFVASGIRLHLPFISNVDCKNKKANQWEKGKIYYQHFEIVPNLMTLVALPAGKSVI